MRTADSRNISRRCFSLFRSSAIKIHRFANEKLPNYRVSRRAGQISPEQRPENAGRASCRVTALQRFRRFFAGTHLAAVRQFGSGLVRCGAAGRVRGTRLPAHGIHHEGAEVAEKRRTAAGAMPKQRASAKARRASRAQTLPPLCLPPLRGEAMGDCPALPLAARKNCNGIFQRRSLKSCVTR